MKLDEYPQAIYTAQQQLNSINAAIADLTDDKLTAESVVDLDIQFDPTLKNEAQRKAKAWEVLSSKQRYSECLHQIRSLKREQAEAAATLDRLRNQFSVAKLELRMAIAQKLTDKDDRELVGLP